MRNKIYCLLFKYSLVTMILLFVYTFPVIGQEVLVGKYEGKIVIPGMELEVSIDFAMADGEIVGSMDIPMQQAKGLKFTEITWSAEEVSFKIPEVPGNASYKGKYDSKLEQLAGMFSQGGMQFPASFTKITANLQEERAAILQNKVATFIRLVDSMRVRTNVAGIGVAVVYNDSLILADGYGYRDLSKQLKVYANTLFAIGSCTKAFTATHLAILVEEGLLHWEDPIRRLLPEFDMYDPIAGQSINAIDILTHRSGLPRHDLSWYGSTASKAELVSRIKYLQPNEGFRSTWQYQNFMYLLAGYLAEKVSGKSWEQSMEDLFFKPLSMKNSNTSIPKMAQNNNSAIGYRYEAKDSTHIYLPYKSIPGIAPAGAINSSAKDMAQWLKFNLNLGEVDGQRLLPASAVDFIHQPHMVMPSRKSKEIIGASYGLGWMTYAYKGKRVVEHGGNIDGFSALVFMCPDDKLGFVLLTNENGTILPNMLARYGTDIFLELGETDWFSKMVASPDNDEETPVPQKAAPIPDTKPTHNLEKFVGTYNHPGYGDLVINQNGDQLAMHFNNMVLDMSHWHYNTFKATYELLDFEVLLTFHLNDKGEITVITCPLEISTDPIRFEKKAPSYLSDMTYMQKLVGEYDFDGFKMKLEVTKGGDLQVLIAGQAAEKIVPLSDHSYHLKKYQEVTFTFLWDDKGKVTGVQLNQMNTIMTGKRMNE
jgi:CubicO group peptidase (beta-lactamase class C family)